MDEYVKNPNLVTLKVVNSGREIGKCDYEYNKNTQQFTAVSPDFNPNLFGKVMDRTALSNAKEGQWDTQNQFYEVNDRITNNLIKTLYESGKTDLQVAKVLLTEHDYSRNETTALIMLRSPNAPNRSDEARNFASEIVERAAKEIKLAGPPKTKEIER